ncbi:MAG: glycosyltransferase [Chloroflexi bacterium]|nr:glycosyltransferase [Chloroflexota bacterium]
MKILHLVHQYLPEHVGGTELYTQMLARQQVAAGHEAAVFFPSTQRTSLEPTTEAGLRVYGAPIGQRSGNQVFAQTMRGGGDLLAAWRHVLAREQPDLVHIQHLMGLPPALVGELHGRIPYLVTLHDYWYGCANAQLFTNDGQENCHGPRHFINCGRCALARAGVRQTWLAPAVAPLMAYRQQLLRPILTGAAAVISPTRFVQNMYRQMGFPLPHAVHIPHGIEISPAQLVEAKSRPQPNQLHLVYIGGLAPQKGLHTLVEAFNSLPPTAALTIWGDTAAFPDYVADLRRLATHPQIRWGGRLPHDQIWNELASASLVAIPTHWYEASSLVLDEGFMVGTPALASNLGVFPEKVRHGVDGLLVPPADTAAWRTALQRLHDQPEFVASLRANVRPPLTAEAHTAQVLALYASLK